MAKHLSVPERHQLKIAQQTLRYSDVGARIMGGPTKAEAREIIRRLTGREPKENPSAGIKAQVRRLPSGQVQIKIPLKSNPVLFEDVEGKPLGRRIDKVRRYGEHMLKGGGLNVKEIAQRLRGVLGKVMDHATITVDDGKGGRAYNPRGATCPKCGGKVERKVFKWPGESRVLGVQPHCHTCGWKGEQRSRRKANPRGRGKCNPRPCYTIKKSDVGKATIKVFNKRWRVDEFIGHIGPYDVGKQVYCTSPGVLQVENDSQFKHRLGL